MHRGSLNTVNAPDSGEYNLLTRLVIGLFLLGYFTVLPIFITLAINWAVYYFTSSNYYHEPWMMPVLLAFSAFVAGVFIRQKIEDGSGGLFKFALGLLGLCLYAYITYLDIHQLGGIYSQYMPMFLRPPLVALIYALPGIGFGGMLFYKFFTLKNYS